MNGNANKRLPSYWPSRDDSDIPAEEEHYWRGVYYMALMLYMVGGPKAAILALREAVVKLTTDRPT